VRRSASIVARGGDRRTIRTSTRAALATGTRGITSRDYHIGLGGVLAIIVVLMIIFFAYAIKGAIDGEAGL
jgi:hypothetical protein